MKDFYRAKELSEKGRNRYKFISFTERVNNINVDIFHRVDKTITDEPGKYTEGAQSFFQEKLEKWLEFNLTEHYSDFVREVRPYISTLPLILFHKERIVKILIKHLKVENSNAYQPLLELTSSLARDLLDEFYPYFGRLLDVIIELIDPHDTNLLDYSFSSIGFMFKFLRKTLIKQIQPLFTSYYYKYLSHRKDYIRQFAGESFSFLLRQTHRDSISPLLLSIFSFLSSANQKFLLLTRDRKQQQNDNQNEDQLDDDEEEIIDDINPIDDDNDNDDDNIIDNNKEIEIDNDNEDNEEELEEEPTEENGKEEEEEKEEEKVIDPTMLSNGVEILLFETVKGVQNRFHSRMNIILKSLLKQIKDQTQITYSIVNNTLQRMCDHSIADVSSEVFDCLFGELDKLLLKLNKGKENSSSSSFSSSSSSNKRSRDTLKDDNYYYRIIKIVKLLQYWTRYKKGEKWQSSPPIRRSLFDHLMKVCQFVFTSRQSSSSSSSSSSPYTMELIKSAMGWMSGALISYGNHANANGREGFDDEFNQYANKLIKSAFLLPKTREYLPLLFSFSLILCGLKDHFAIALKEIIVLCNDVVDEYADEVMNLLIDIHKSPSWSRIKCGLYVKLSHSSRFNFDIESKLIHYIKNDIVKGFVGSNGEKNREKLFLSLLCLNCIHVDYKSIVLILQQLNSLLLKTIQSDQPEKLLLLAHSYLSIIKLYSSYQQIKLYDVFEEMMEIVDKYPHNLHLLSTISQLMSMIEISKYSDQKSAVLNKLREYKRLIPFLAHNLSSTNQSLRLQTYLLLSHFDFELTKKKNGLSVDAMNNMSIIDVFIKAEETNFATLAAGSISHLYQNLNPLLLNSGGKSDFTDEEIYVIIHSLLGSFFLKFTPLWKYIIENLKSLSSSHFPALWKIISNKLNDVNDAFNNHHFISSSLSSHSAPRYEKMKKTLKNVKLNRKNEENEEKISSAFIEIQTLYQNEVEKGDASLYIIRSTSTDLFSFHSLILQTFCQISQQVEAKSAEVIPHFLNFIYYEFAPIHWHDFPLDQLYSSSKFTPEGRVPMSRLTMRQMSEKLSNFLKLFALFRNAVSLKYSPLLFDLFLMLLSNKQANIQTLSLNCIKTWKLPYVDPYLLNLQRIIDEKTFRDEITTFVIARTHTVSSSSKNKEKTEEMKSDINDEHREKFVPILCRVLYGKLFVTKRGTPHRRGPTLSYLCSLDPTELSTIFDLLLLPFQPLIAHQSSKYTSINDKMKKKKEKDQYIDETTLEIVEKLTYKKKVGFVNLMKDVLGQLGTNLEMYLPSLLHTTLPLLLSSVIKANEDLQHNERDERYAEWGAIRNLGLKRLSSLIDIFPFYDYTPWLTLEFIGYLKPNITRIVSENKDSSTPLLSFFITISKYSTLLYLFEENQFIIPNIIECFSRANISPMIISEILGIIENLLDLQLNSDGHLHLINPFVDLLLFHLKSLNTKPNLSQKILRRQLAVLKNISTFATDGDKAFDLLTMLLPYLVRRIDHNSKLDIISIFSNLFHLLRSKSTIGFIDQISMLFRSFTDQDSRGKLCNVFVEIEKVEIALEGIPPLLFDLNSYSSKMIGDYDYDRRLSAYSKINSLFDISKLSSDDDSDEKEIQPVALVPIIYNLIYYMRDKDVSIYSHSTNSLTVIIQYIAHQVKRYEDKMEEEGGEEGKTIALSYRKLITNLILPNAKRFIKSDDHNLRCQSFDLFSEITKCFKDIHADLAVLISPSFGNYFLAMKNVNIPKKIKVLQLLRGKIEGKLFHFTSKSIVQILIPSLLPFISKTTKANDEGNLVEESIKVIGAFSSILPWSSYYSTLNSFIKLVHKNPQSIKSLMRLCCQLLDHFHFEISDGDQYRDTIQYLNMDFNPPKPLLQLNQGSADDTNGEDVSMADVPSGEPPKVIIKEETTTATATPLSASPKKIISVIINHIIPTFQSFIKEEKGMQSNNIHVALAVVKLLKLLPDHLIQTHLPQLILKIVGNLRVKDQSVRDDTRATLLRVFESLGCSYFPIILTELSTVLQKGYQLHVLGFTLHYLLSNAKSFLSVGCFDDLCLSQLIYLLLEDIFGEAAEKKEVAAIQNSMKEAKKTKSFESFEMIAQFMTFKSQISLFLSPLRALLLSTVSAKVIKKVDDILKKIILGLSHNTSIYFNQPSSNDAIVQMKEGGDDDDDEDDKTGSLVFIYNIVKKNLQFMNKDMKAIKASSDQLSSLLLAQSSKISRLSNAIDKRNKNNNLFLIPDEPVKLRKRKNDVFIMQSTLTSFNQSTSNKKKAVESGSKAERKVEINLHVIGEFGLSLFFAFLQKNKFETKNQKDLQMINPFISLFLSSIASSLHQKTILHTLKCLEKLFYFNLPSTEENMEEILSRLFTLLQQCFQSTSHHHLSSQPSAQQLIKIELSQQCVKTLTVLIHYSEKLKISEDQIKYLVKLVQLNIDNTEVLTQNITFKLIKTIIQKKLIIPEIYDLANQVAEYVVTSQISSIRDTCSKSLVHFLLFYPLEEKRLQQHLDFIVRNLSYKTEEGRESTLSLFHLLISKLPSPEIEKQAEYFFLSLVLRLINEESKSCRIMVSSVIKLLIEKISHPKLLILFNLTKQWFSQSSSSSTTTSSTSSATSHIKQRAGAQVIGIMIEVLHSSFYSKFPDVLSLLYHPISLEDDDGTDDNNNNEVNDDQEDDDEDNKKWEITYYSLISLEKLLSCTPSLILSPDMIKVWKKISELIMHSHTWIRSISSRLFGVLFSQFNPRSISPPSSSSSSSTSPSKKVKGKKKNNNKEEKNNKEEVKGVLYEKGFIFKLTRKFCSQLQSENLSSDLAKQTLKNLIFLTQSIYFNPHLSDDLSILSFSSSLITPRRHQLDDDANADDNNDNDNDDDKRKGNDEIEIDKEIAEMKEENHMQFIHWIFRRLSFMARRSLRRPETVKSIYQWFAAITTIMSAEMIKGFLIPMISPLYRTVNAPKAFGPLFDLANEVLELIKEKVGVEEYFKAHHFVRDQVQLIRTNRKSAIAREAVLDPQRNAIRKQKKNLKSSLSRKKKFQSKYLNKFRIKVGGLHLDDNNN